MSSNLIEGYYVIKSGFTYCLLLILKSFQCRRSNYRDLYSNYPIFRNFHGMKIIYFSFLQKLILWIFFFFFLFLTILFPNTTSSPARLSQIKKINSTVLTSYGLFAKISEVSLNMDEFFSKIMNLQFSEWSGAKLKVSCKGRFPLVTYF